MEHTCDSINSEVEKRIIKHGSKGGILRLINKLLKKLPSSIGNLINLKELYLNNNQLYELPSSIGNLSNLEKLYLDYNELKEIPQSITRLTNLKHLDIAFQKCNEDFIYPPYYLIEPISGDEKKQAEVVLEYCRTHSLIKTRYNELWNCIKLMYIGHYKEIIHCKDTFGNIPIEVIGVIGELVCDHNPIIKVVQSLSRESFINKKSRRSVSYVIAQKYGYVKSVQHFIEKNAYNALTYLQSILEDALTCQDVYHTASKCMLRLMYILMAESKNILPYRNKTYRYEYSITYMIKTIRDSNIKGVLFWRKLCNTFELLRNPSDDLSDLIPVHALDLFDKDETWEEDAIVCLSKPDFNERIMDFLCMIGTWKDKKGRDIGLIDFESFSPRDIGDMYEILLAASNRAQKEQCAFYTPNWAVSHMVKKVLDPLIQKYITCNDDDDDGDDKKSGIDKLLSLSILDPAMGSGHFLVEMVIQLASRIMVEYMHDENCESKEINAMYDSGDELEMALRTRIAMQCIYGVDINPIAADLARCAIVLVCDNRVVSQKQLDTHLICGDSIMGCVSFKDVAALDTLSPLGMSVQKYLETQKSANRDSLELLAKIRILTSLSLPDDTVKVVRKYLDGELDGDLDAQKKEVQKKLHTVGSSVLHTHLTASVHWMLEFPLLRGPDDFSNPKFDVIITNPPWLAVGGGSKSREKTDKLSDYLDSVRSLSNIGLYHTLPTGQPNLYHFFLERCMQLLHPDHGQLGFLVQASVLSAKWNGGSYFSNVTNGFCITSLLEFPNLTLFDNVDASCVIFTASRSPVDASDYFPYKKFTRDEVVDLKACASSGQEYTIERFLGANISNSGHLIKNVIYPHPIPPMFLSLVNAFLGNEREAAPWLKYHNYCTVVQGGRLEGSDKITHELHSRTGKGVTPLIKNLKVQHFAHLGEGDATFWSTSSRRSSDFSIRLVTKKVINCQNPRRLRGALMIDSVDGYIVWGYDGTVIHDFTGKPDILPGFSVHQRAYIFCCLMNSDLLECIIRCFDFTNNISSGKIQELPLPNWTAVSPHSEWLPDWDILRSIDGLSSVRTALELLNAPSLDSPSCILLCLATIGNRMHELTTVNPKNGVVTLKTPTCKSVLALMNRMINTLYGLTSADELYIKAIYRDELHVLSKRL